jgi:hypothetical protein
VILADAVPRDETVNSGIDIGMLTKLRKGSTEFLLQNDSARPLTSLKAWEQIIKFGWTVLPHLPYSPGLSPSDFHLFGALKDAVCGMNLRVVFAQ